MPIVALRVKSLVIFSGSTFSDSSKESSSSSLPGTKTGEMIGNIATGGNFLNDVGKKAGRSIGSKVKSLVIFSGSTFSDSSKESSSSSLTYFLSNESLTRRIGSKVDDFIHKKNRERRKLKEDSEVIYRSPEYKSSTLEPILLPAFLPTSFRKLPPVAIFPIISPVDRKYVKLEDDDSFEESEKVDPEKITRDLTLKATILLKEPYEFLYL